MKFTVPQDGVAPENDWGVYPFKGTEEFDPITLRSKDNQMSAFCFGRDPTVAHIVMENPSCSAQHAVIQFREKLKTIELTPE